MSLLEVAPYGTQSYEYAPVSQVLGRLALVDALLVHSTRRENYQVAFVLVEYSSVVLSYARNVVDVGNLFVWPVRCDLTGCMRVHAWKLLVVSLIRKIMYRLR
jgi:hypothetical protein